MDADSYCFDGDFRFGEVSFDEFPKAVFQCLRGEIAGCITRSAYSQEICSALSTRFAEHKLVRIRTGDASGAYLGTFHWRKQLDHYFKESTKFRATMNSFSPEWNTLITSLESEFFQKGCELRTSQLNGQPVCTPLVRLWNAGHDYALIPHEDLSQCYDPIQSGWDVQSGTPALGAFSLNLCIENDGGGDLVMWDRAPTRSEREALGTLLEGGPYPTSFVENAERLVCSVDAGDLYFFNGALVHAVSRTLGRRATISCLMRPANPEMTEVLMWT